MAEELCHLFVQFTANLDGVAWPDHLENLFEISLCHTNASVRSSLADRTRYIRSVDPIAFLTKSDPASSERIVCTRFDHSSAVVVGGLHDSVHDLELAFRAWGDRGAH